jgi:chorismate mutase
MDEIKGLRGKIDAIDAQWLGLLAERFKITAEVGKIKARDGIAPTDSNRESLQMQKIEKLALQMDLNPILAQNILRLIIDETVRNHKNQSS